MWNKLFLLALGGMLPACSYSTFYVPNERVVYPATSPSSVAISSQKTVNLPHKIIGRVATINWGGGESVRESLQNQAAHLGANLVIDFQMESGFGKTSGSGLAVVVYRDK